MTPERHQQIQDLFLRAVEIDESHRKEWLEKECGGDDSLFSEVNALLAHDDTRTLLDVEATDLGRSRNDNAAHVQPAAKRRSSRLLWVLRCVPPGGLVVIAAMVVLLPIIAYALIADRVLDRFKKNLRATSLSEGVDTQASAIRLWLLREQNVVQSWADSSRIRQLIAELAEIATAASSEQRTAVLRSAASQSLLNQELESLAVRPVHYKVWDSRLMTIAASPPDGDGIGDTATSPLAERLIGVLAGNARLIVIGARNASASAAKSLSATPTFGIFVPVSNREGTVIAVLLVHHSGVEDGLSEFVQSARHADSTDVKARTFLFDASGALLFDSPYDAQLQDLGLIPAETAGSQSPRRLVLRDPGVDLTRGETPRLARDEQPLTKLVRMATSEGAGVDVEGYRDVRGVMVAGAWRWLEEYHLGIGLEIEKDAVEPAIWLAQLQSWAMLSVLGIGLSFAGYSMFVIRRLKSQLDAEHRIGPYVLERMVGEGGMGRVFLARHELLKRATAIKLLRPEVVNDMTISRFQHEAQLAARLEHPNTVSVYDFGVTDDGQCYLVMEWIDGLTLDELIERDGALPVTRCAHILRQVAMSLREAHSLGLIHRDLKPQNIMVTQRASEADVVKVLDFGLARDLFTPQPAAQLSSRWVAGSPRYMAPERWDPALPAGPAIDVYAFGCIAYFMLTGNHAVQGDSIETICANSFTSGQRPPSDQAPHRHIIPPWLDQLTVQCMAAQLSERPPSFDEVLMRLQPLD